MRLAEILATLPRSDLEAIARNGLRETDLPSAFLAGALETALRSYAHIRQAIIRRQPPTFAILEVLLEADQHRVDRDTLRARAEEETRAIAARVDDGATGRTEAFRLYRRVLAEARRSELDLDPSETAILGVLRHELGISYVEHFLAEHHADLRTFWDKPDALDRELLQLHWNGIAFVMGDEVVLPDDVVSSVERCIGVTASRGAARRTYAELTGQQLSDALDAKGMKVTGSKEEKVSRLVDNFVQPLEVLEHVNLAELRELARKTGCNVGGSRDELAERLADHFARGLDLKAAAPQEEPPPPAQEPRVLDQARFRALFMELTASQLGDVLGSMPGLRQSGSKDVRVTTLWQCHLSEVSLLNELTGRDLEWLLSRCSLKTSGTKAERVVRLIDHFRAFVMVPDGEQPSDGSAAGASSDRQTDTLERAAAPEHSD
jgi:hypothetical protein